MSLLVQNYMTYDPVSVKENDFMVDVYEILDSAKFRHLPVTDSNGKIVGIISDRDLRNIRTAMDLLETKLNNEEPQMQVQFAMTKNVQVVFPETSLVDAAKIFNEKKIGALPVVKKDDNTLLGIITYTDILRAFIDIQTGA